jgi:hypothetical protein
MIKTNKIISNGKRIKEATFDNDNDNDNDKSIFILKISNKSSFYKRKYNA